MATTSQSPKSKKAKKSYEDSVSLQAKKATGESAAQPAITVTFSAEISKDGNMFHAYSPSLKICSQGASKSAAKRNIKEASTLLIEVFAERGTLHKDLTKRGLKKFLNSESEVRYR